MKDEQRELLAAYAHEAWSEWMKYLFERSLRVEDGSVLLDPKHVARWRYQMNTPYAELPENMKESDRAEADKIRKLLGLVL